MNDEDLRRTVFALLARYTDGLEVPTEGTQVKFESGEVIDISLGAARAMVTHQRVSELLDLWFDARLIGEGLNGYAGRHD